MYRPPRARTTADVKSNSCNFSPVFIIDEQIDGTQPSGGASQTGYYTNLIVNGDHESQNASEAIINEGHTAAKTKGRSQNFKDHEDILLVSAWLNVGMDPIQGADQSQGTYWARIYQYFHDNKEFESTCTESSLCNRWSTIQHDVNLFCGCLSRIEARPQSGTRIEDKIAEACKLFKAEDKKKNTFKLMHCWNILKDQAKWKDNQKKMGSVKNSNKKQKKVAHSSPGSVEPVELVSSDAGGSQGIL